MCTKCGVSKPLDDFYMVAQKRKGKWYKWRRGACKVCHIKVTALHLKQFRARKRALRRKQPV